MTDEPMPTSPREPEIELLGRVAHEALRLMRGALWVGGVTALVYGYEQYAAPSQNPAMLGVSNPVMPSALGTIWITLGLPLVLPTCWLLKKRWACISMAILYSLMWFVPMNLPDDSPYGFILRFFTTTVALSTLLVWRTLWQLTNPNPRPTA
jgi:hypothetical protein